MRTNNANASILCSNDKLFVLLHLECIAYNTSLAYEIHAHHSINSKLISRHLNCWVSYCAFIFPLKIETRKTNDYYLNNLIHFDAYK